MDDFEIEIIEDSELPHRPPPLTPGHFHRWGRPEAGPVCVLIHQDVLRTTQEHARSTPAVEIGGILVGEVYHHEGRTYTEAQHYVFIPNAVGPSSSNVHFNFSGEVWTALNQWCDILYPTLTIVGWFHSHPNHGIFLSSMDLDVQRKAAYQPWQIAMVYDPQRHEGGVFSWRGTEMDKVAGFYELFAADQTAPIMSWRNILVPAAAQPSQVGSGAAPVRESVPPPPAPTTPRVVQPAAPLPELSRRPPRPHRRIGKWLFGLATVLVATALIAFSSYVVWRVMDNNQRAQESRLNATRLADEFQIHNLQATVAAGGAAATEAVNTVEARLIEMEQTQTAAVDANASQAAAAQTQAAAALTQAAEVKVTLEAILTAPAATPTPAVNPSPTNTNTPSPEALTPVTPTSEVPTPEAPPTVLITPLPPGGTP